MKKAFRVMLARLFPLASAVVTLEHLVLESRQGEGHMLGACMLMYAC